jgi:hypothetical protein
MPGYLDAQAHVGPQPGKRDHAQLRLTAALGAARQVEQTSLRRLLAVKAGDHELTPEQEVLDLKISDYLVEVGATENISYQDALIVAMKRERAAFELYTDMAAQVPESHLKEVLQGLAKEEAKHKLFFESEYDDRVLMDN